MEDGRSDVGKDGHWKERGALSEGTKGDEGGCNARVRNQTDARTPHTI